MSVRIMTLIWSFNCPMQDKIVLLKLADCGNDQGESIYPSKKLVAGDCGCSLRHVHSVIERYVSLGVIHIETQGGGRGNVTVYALDIDVIKSAPSAQKEAGINSAPQTVNATQTVHPTQVNSAPHAINSAHGASDTIYKNHKEPSENHCRASNDAPSIEGVLIPELEEEPEPVLETAIIPEIVDDVSDVILHLNTVAGKTHKTDTKASREYINALIKKGATIADMKLVAEYKVTRWKGDATMDECLRPSTLYRACNFDGYLVEAQAWNDRGRVELRGNGKPPPESMNEQYKRLMREREQRGARA